MTTIAWDGMTLAADRQATVGNAVFMVNKLHRHGGVMLAYCGDSDSGEEMLAWFKAGAKPEDFPSNQRDNDRFAPLVAISAGEILRFERTPHPVRYPPQKFAMGSGRDFALAAMHCGKSAAEAVEVAALFDPGTGFGVDTMELE